MSNPNYPMDDKGNKLGDAYGWDTEAGDFSHLDNHIVGISNFNFYKKALSDVLPELLEFQKLFNYTKFTNEDYTKFDEIQKKIKTKDMSNIIIQWSSIMEWLIRDYPEICVNIGIRTVLTQYYNPMITKAKELLDKFKKFEYMYSYGLYNIYQNFINNGFYNLGLYIEKINEMNKLLDEIILLYPELVLLWRTYRIELDYCLKFKPLSVSAHMTLPLPENSRPRRPIGDDEPPKVQIPLPSVRPRRPIGDDEPQYTGPIQTAQMSMTNQNVVQGNQSLSYKEKYLKYKQKYLDLKNQIN
jgi:hypothetical protein